MSQLLNVGEAATLNAHLYPDKIAARDLARSMTFRQWNRSTASRASRC